MHYNHYNNDQFRTATYASDGFHMIPLSTSSSISNAVVHELSPLRSKTTTWGLHEERQANIFQMEVQGKVTSITKPKFQDAKISELFGVDANNKVKQVLKKSPGHRRPGLQGRRHGGQMLTDRGRASQVGTQMRHVQPLVSLHLGWKTQFCNTCLMQTITILDKRN